MDEIGEYHAKCDKPISKNQRTNDLADKWMMTHNGGREGLELGLEFGLGRGARMEEGRTV